VFDGFDVFVEHFHRYQCLYVFIEFVAVGEFVFLGVVVVEEVF